ncbi:MAG TPA: hypothetical protein VGW75_11665, partial [Solirubrobacteraceae bacterium]|nr:hypothetical protein [Solirubrobacteraceae bacterium]
MSSLAECLEQVLGAGPGSDGEAFDWLAARGLGLVRVDDPAAFAWPGRFLGRWVSGEWVVLFGVPPGVVHGSVESGELAEAYVVAPHQPVARPAAALAGSGVVEGVYIAPAAEAPMVAADAVPAVAGRGLEGDRYFDGAGTFSRPGSTGHDLTLVDAAALAAAGVAPLEA